MKKFLARFSVFFSGSRWRFTMPGDTTSRFELVAIQIHEPRKVGDPETALVVRFKTQIPAGYKARRRDQMYFNPTRKRWFLITEDGYEIMFAVEAVGAFFLIFRKRLKDLGCDITGYDVRSILFRALHEHEEGLHIHVMNMKGKELCDYAKKMLVEHRGWFTPEEHALIEEYLEAR